MLTRNSLLKILFLDAILLIFLANSSASCLDTCFKSKSPCESYKRITGIFSGSLVSVKESEYLLSYTFRVDKTYKGKHKKIVHGVSLKEIDCLRLPALTQGEKYLVFVYSSGGRNLIMKDEYFETKLLTASGQELQQLRKNKRQPFLNSKNCKPS